MNTSVSITIRMLVFIMFTILTQLRAGATGQL
jgi:hypothetical protein